MTNALYDPELAAMLAPAPQDTPDLYDEELAGLLAQSNRVTTKNGRYSVLDGDTIQDTNTGERYRLAGVNTNETAKPGRGAQRNALEAKMLLAQMLDEAGDNVQIDRKGSDKYGRTVAAINAGGRDLSESLISSGHGFAFMDQGEYGDTQRFANRDFDTSKTQPLTVDELAYLEGQRQERHHVGQGTGKRAVIRGMDNAQMALYGAVNAGAKALGLESVAQWSEEGIQDNIQELMHNPAQIGTYENIDSLSDAGTYLVEALGEQIPTFAVDLGAAVASGGVGAIASALSRKAALRAATDHFMKGQIKSQIGKDAARAARAGGVASIYAQSTGETQLGLMEEGIDAPGTAFGVGALKAGLEYAGIASMLKGLSRSTGVAEGTLKSMAAEIGKRAGISMGAEGSTEGMQTVLDFMAISAHDPEFDMFSEDNIRELKDAVLKGAIVGGTVRAGSEALGAGRAEFQKWWEEDLPGALDNADTGEFIGPPQPDYPPRPHQPDGSVAEPIAEPVQDDLSFSSDDTQEIAAREGQTPAFPQQPPITDRSVTDESRTIFGELGGELDRSREVAVPTSGPESQGGGQITPEPQGVHTDAPVLEPDRPGPVGDNQRGGSDPVQPIAMGVTESSAGLDQRPIDPVHAEIRAELERIERERGARGIGREQPEAGNVGEAATRSGDDGGGVRRALPLHEMGVGEREATGVSTGVPDALSTEEDEYFRKRGEIDKGFAGRSPKTLPAWAKLDAPEINKLRAHARDLAQTHGWPIEYAEMHAAWERLDEIAREKEDRKEAEREEEALLVQHLGVDSSQLRSSQAHPLAMEIQEAESAKESRQGFMEWYDTVGDFDSVPLESLGVHEIHETIEEDEDAEVLRDLARINMRPTHLMGEIKERKELLAAMHPHYTFMDTFLGQLPNGKNLREIIWGRASFQDRPESLRELERLRRENPNSEFQFQEYDKTGWYRVIRKSLPEPLKPEPFDETRLVRQYIAKAKRNARIARRRRDHKKILPFTQINQKTGEVADKSIAYDRDSSYLHAPTITELGLKLTPDSEKQSEGDAQWRGFLAGLAEITRQGYYPSFIENETDMPDFIYTTPAMARPLSVSQRKKISLLIHAKLAEYDRIKSIRAEGKGLDRKNRELRSIEDWLYQHGVEYGSDGRSLPDEFAGAAAVEIRRSPHSTKTIVNQEDKSTNTVDMADKENERKNDEERRFDENGEFIRYARKGDAGQGISMAVAKAVTDQFEKYVGGRYPVKVKLFETMEDAHGPGDYSKYKGTKAGLSEDGRTIFAYTSVHLSAGDLRRTLRHELFAHYGLAGYLRREDIVRLLRAVERSTHPKIQKAVAQARIDYADKSNSEQLEEALAAIAETTPHNKVQEWLHHFVKAFNALMRRMGLAREEVTPTEIHDLMLKIRDKIRRGDAVNAELNLPSETVFRRSALQEQIRQNFTRTQFQQMVERGKDIATKGLKVFRPILTADRVLRKVAGAEFADLFWQQTASVSRAARAGLFNILPTKRGMWLEDLHRLEKSMTSEEWDAALQQLQAKRPAEAGTPAMKIRKFLDSFYEYQKERAPTLGRLENYFPRMWDIQAIQDDPRGFDDMMRALGYKDPASIRETLVTDGGMGDELFKTAIGPGFRQGKTLTLDHADTDRLAKERGFLIEEPAAILEQYIISAVRNAEYQRSFGGYKPIADFHPLAQTLPEMADEMSRRNLMQIGRYMEGAGMMNDVPRWADAPGAVELVQQRIPQAIEQGYLIWEQEDARAIPVWYDRNYRITRKRQEILEADGQDAVNRFDRIMNAYMGRLGQDMDPAVRKAMSGLLVYESYLTLMFSAVASLPDLAGPILTSKDFRSMKNAFRGMAKVAKDKASIQAAYERAHLLGTISRRTTNQALLDLYGQAHTSGFAQNAMEKLFHYNGQEMLTNFTRVMATTVGENFILDHAQRNDPKSRRYLQELNIHPEVVNRWVAGGKKPWTHDMGGQEASDAMAVQQAIGQFVDNSIVRPNAAHRPVWASDPRFVLIWHLKSFFYSYGKVVMGGILREAKTRYREADGDQAKKAIAASLPFVAAGLLLLPLAAAGLELREMIQYAGMDKPTDRMDSIDYLGELTSRAGVYGPLELGAAFFGVGSYDAGPITLAGPTIQHVSTIINSPAEIGFKRSLPVFNQNPALWNAVKETF